MVSGFRKKSSNVFILFLVILLVGSLVFSFGSGRSGGAGIIAKVGGEPISYTEFDNEYRRQMEFYKNISGGKELTRDMIKRFGIKRNVLNMLVNRKLIQILAEDLDLSISDEEIKEKIKELPYFQTAGKFDVTKYKQLLSYNRMNPAEFEKSIREDTTVQKISKLLSESPLSPKLISEIDTLEKNNKKATLVSIDLEGIQKLIPVSQSQINSFLKKEINKAKTEAQFKQEKSSLDSPEKIRARHILIKKDTKNAQDKIAKLKKRLTKKNFSQIAQKETEDPSGKNNGGYLGEFSRGKMVKTFENAAFAAKVGEVIGPITTQFGTHFILVEKKSKAKIAQFSEYKNSIAKKIIQKESTDEIKKLTAKYESIIFKDLKTKKMKALGKLEKQKLISLTKDINFTPLTAFEAFKGKLTAEEASTIYRSKNSIETIKRAASNLYIAMEDGDKSSKTNAVETLQKELSSKLNQKILENLREKYPPRLFSKEILD